MKSMTKTFIAFSVASLLGSGAAFAQYPTGSEAAAAAEAAQARNAEGNKRSEEAHRQAMEVASHTSRSDPSRFTSSPL